MLKTLFSVFSIFLLCSFVKIEAQEILVCPDHFIEESSSSYGGNSSLNGEECFEKCEYWYAPKVVNLHFHVIQDENGEHNFQETDGWWFAELVNVANQRLEDNDHYSHANVSFQVEDVSFYQQSDWCTSGNGNIPPNPPEMDFTINVFMVENCGDWANDQCDLVFLGANCPGGWAPIGGDHLTMHRSYYRGVNQAYSCDEFEHRANLLIHEAGHNFGLGHTQNPGDNFMSWSPCGNDFFNCGQVDDIHDHLENAGNVDYTWVPNNSVCEASFELTDIAQYCNVTITNTSTPSVPNAIIETEWCVENLSTNEVTPYYTYDLEFDADNGTEYEVCLCISDGECETYHCEIMNFDPVPAGFTSDVNGDPKDHFCLGEDVYFNATESMNESRWFLSIWKYNIGGFAAGESHLDYSRTQPWWTQGEAGIIHLNPIYDNYADPSYFEPGFEYRIQYVVRGHCDPHGWNVIEDILFYVDCCEGDEELCDAGFTTEVEIGPGGEVTIEVTRVPAYPWETNNFGVYTHDEPGLGPYTYSSGGSGDSFTINGSWPGCFTIVNKVTTPCGECCFSQEICIDEGGLTDNDNDFVVNKVNGDCSLIDELCLRTPPTGLGCVMKFGNVGLYWDEVPGATGYLVEIYPFDPECCEGGEGSPYSIETETNRLKLQLFATCFSYRVFAICPDGLSWPSEKNCFNIFTGCGSPDSPKKLNHQDGEQFENINNSSSMRTADSRMEVYPNPTSGQFNFSIQKLTTTDVKSIKIMDIHGRVVDQILNYEDNGSTINGSWNFDSSAQNGIYLIEVILDNEILSKRIIFGG